MGQRICIDTSPKTTYVWATLQACEQTVNITNHQGNANQNHNETSFHTC